MTEYPLISFQKTYETKYVTFIFPEDNNNKEYRSLNIFLKAGINNLNSELHIKLQKISELGKSTTKVSVANTKTYYYSDIDFLDLIGLISPKENLRIVVNLSKFYNRTNSTLKEHNISHLVEIGIDEVESGCTDSSNISSAKIAVKKKEQIINLIEDILLDISMYYTYMPNIKDKNDIDFKISFSKKKVDFIINEKLSSWHGEINKNIGYVSLASICRTEHGIDLHEYVKLWNKLVFSICPEINTSFTSKVHESPIMKQLKNHKEFYELPLQKILNIFESKDKGSYLLLRINKSRPDDKGIKNKILYIFRTNRWSRGAIIVIPSENYFQIKNYSNFISIFKIEI